MVSYLVDTNIFLRFLVNDNLKHYKESKKYLLLAKQNKIKLYILPQVIFEIEYVLKKVYKVDKPDIVRNIDSLLRMTYLSIENKEKLIEALKCYKFNNIDFVDALIHTESVKRKINVLTFDKDFKKIKS